MSEQQTEQKPIKLHLTDLKNDYGLFPMDFVKRKMELDPERNPKAEQLYRAYYIDDLTLYFLLDLYSRLITNQSFILSIFGPPGSSKSFGGGFIVEFIRKVTGKNFYICHNRTQTRETLRELVNKGEDYCRKIAVMMDEQEVKNVGVGSNREKDDMTDIMNMVREWQICFICISPDVREHPHDFLLQALREFDDERLLSKYLVYYPDNPDMPAGFVITKKPTEGFLSVYKEAKRSNIIRVLKGEGTGRYQALKDLASKLVKSPYFQGAKEAGVRRLFVEENTEGYTKEEQKRILTYANQFLKELKLKETHDFLDNIANGAAPRGVTVVQDVLDDKDKQTIEIWPKIKSGEITIRKAAEKLGYGSHSSLIDRIKKMKKRGLIKDEIQGIQEQGQPDSDGGQGVGKA